MPETTRNRLGTPPVTTQTTATIPERPLWIQPKRSLKKNDHIWSVFVPHLGDPTYMVEASADVRRCAMLSCAESRTCMQVVDVGRSGCPSLVPRLVWPGLSPGSLRRSWTRVHVDPELQGHKNPTKNHLKTQFSMQILQRMALRTYTYIPIARFCCIMVQATVP